MMFPNKKWSAAKRVKSVPEASIQSFVDDYLSALQIENIRIPDALWRLIHATGNPGVIAQLRKAIGGISDNTCMIPISEDYSLCLHLELKSATGKLHGKQKINAKKLPWKIARSPEEAKKFIDEFKRKSGEIRKILSD